MRLKTPVVQIGSVKIGGTNPVAIQSMTNTDTADVKATVSQIIELAKAGSELVRITVSDEKSAQAVPKIRTELNKKGYKNLPLIGDFHFNGHLLLEKYPDCAKTLDKYRINPGNVGNEKNFESIIKIAIKNNKPVRIGVNAGSIGNKSMVDSALNSAKLAEKNGLKRNKIVMSVKASSVLETIRAYELLAEKMRVSKRIYAIHLGLTEAGGNLKGIISSTAAVSILLQKGIGDTIRISLTPSPKELRSKEVEVCKILLQSLGLRSFSPQITSCPGCGRAANQVFQKLNRETEKFIQKNTKKFAKNPNFRNLKIAIMGCIVNGPGEAKRADIAICLPGKNESKKAAVFIKGKFSKTISGKNINKEFLKILEQILPII